MRKETVLKQKDFSVNGNQYSVRQLDRGRFDIVVKEKIRAFPSTSILAKNA